ncbi:zinc finger protein 624-like [Leguminivora glycinivorella]|uniref:zinc finger protein 624-like n=1 Tax=Leguminivora glycinivorella TaxID=1035111 RepID=UPI002010212D|nr:zinc finger protein 624-like [Leguminivora glycinivorella]
MESPMLLNTESVSVKAEPCEDDTIPDEPTFVEIEPLLNTVYVKDEVNYESVSIKDEPSSDVCVTDSKHHRVSIKTEPLCSGASVKDEPSSNVCVKEFKHHGVSIKTEPLCSDVSVKDEPSSNVCVKESKHHGVSIKTEPLCSNVGDESKFYGVSINTEPFCSNTNVKESNCHDISMKSEPLCSDTNVKDEPLVGSGPELYTEHAMKDELVLDPMLCHATTGRIRKKLRTKLKTYQCDHCEYTTSRKIGFDRHLRKHNQPYTPDECDFASDDQSQDQAMTHTGEKPKKSNLQSDKQNHNEDKPYECDQCSYSASHEKDLVIHMRKHTGERPFKCNQCDHATISQKYLQAHYKRHDSSAKPYKCDQCKNAYTSKRGLEDHKLMIHIKAGSMPATDGISVSTSISGKTLYKCGKCPYVNSRKWYVQLHAINAHSSEEKPYKLYHLYS